MRFGEFLERAPRGAPTCTRGVTFRALNPASPVSEPIAVNATIAPLSEDERQLLGIAATRTLAERFPDQSIPPHIIADEILYHRIAACLRDSSNPTTAFFDTPTQARSALTLATAQDLADEIDAFHAEEFPPTIDDATMAALEKDAAGKSYSALLSEYGSSPAGRRALRGFLARCMRSLTLT